MKADERHGSVSADALWIDGNVGKQWFVIDIRSGDEYRRGHIPGAVHVPSGELVNHDVRIKLAAGGRPIACVCSPEQDLDRGRAQFDYLGAGVMRVVEGGVRSWFDLGFPLVPSPFLAQQTWQEWCVSHLGIGLMVAGAALGTLAWPGFLLMMVVGWVLQTGRLTRR